MNIWLPIVTNLVLVLVVLAGALVGRKTKWYLELSKIFCLGGIGVAAHFLIPTFNNLLIKIPFISNIVERLELSIALNSISFALMFLLGYVAISIIFAIINCIVSKDGKKVHVSKAVKVKAANGKKPRHTKKPANVFGVIFGAFIGLMLSFVLYIPLKYVSIGIVDNKPELEQITSSYEYTAFGKLDDLTNIVEVIIEK